MADPEGTVSSDSPGSLYGSSQEVTSPTGIEVGDILGRYTVRGRIGAGGMGEVFAGHDPELERPVALKVLRPGVVGMSSQGRARFQREAQAMARLNHPNVVSVYDVDTVGNRLFVAMELVEGPTLAAWLAERPRSWREVVHVFLQAGRGLEAAHQAGIVHRDFKPSNVIVGDRVRVADFGLARGQLDLESEVSTPATAVLDLNVTQTGQRLGTPAYMSPEQLMGLSATTASDQYAFSVALHEALYGARPGGKVVVPRNLPGWLRAVVQRGLALQPEDRYPSMTALLVALGYDPARTRRRVLLAASATILVAGTVVAFVVGKRQADTAACNAGASLAAEVWNDDTRASVHKAFAATGLLYAEDTFGRVDGTVRRRMSAWADAHREACLATHARHEQSSALLDLRMGCLEHARKDAATLVSLLAQANAATVDRSVNAVANAADTAPCEDAAALTALVPPPRDPEAIREDAELRTESARVSNLRTLGRVKEAVEPARTLAARAQRFSHAPAVAVALVAAQQVESQGGDVEKAIQLAYGAVAAADAAHDDAKRSESLSRLLFDLGYKRHRFAEADVVFHLARAAISRAGDRADLLRIFFYAANGLYEAKDEYVMALAYAVAELGVALQDGWPSAAVAAALGDMGSAQKNLGANAAARSLLHASTKVAEDALGPEHPQVATCLLQEVQAAVRVADYRFAAETATRVVALRERVYGSTHPNVAVALLALSDVLRGQGHLDEARATLERANKILHENAGDPNNVLIAEYDLAQILALQGHLAPALEMGQHSLKGRAALDGNDSLRYALTESMVAEFLRRANRFDESKAAFEHALSIFDAKHQDGAETGFPRVSLALTLKDSGDSSQRVVELCRDGLAAIAKAYDPTTEEMVDAQISCSWTLLTADPPMARALSARAEAAIATAQLRPEIVAGAKFIAAEHKVTRDRRAACALAQEARALDAALPYAVDMPKIVAWLKKHGCTD